MPNSSRWLDDLKNKKIMVLGLGKSGISVIEKLSEKSLDVIAVDLNPALNIGCQLDFVAKKKNFKLEVRLDEEADKKPGLLDGVEMIIVSPGISNENGLVKAADNKGIPIISEIEFGWQLLDESEKKNTIAVTGTNGKTTVVTLIQKIFAGSGLDAVSCGNIGNPLTAVSGKGFSPDLIRVIEVSSFQLERIKGFNPFTGIMLNITGDHMDRHHSMKNYAQIKFRLFSNSGAGQWGIFNADDANICSWLRRAGFYSGRGFSVLQSSIKKQIFPGIYYKNGRVLYEISSKVSGEIDITDSSLVGNHNISNMMACIAAAKIFGLKDNSIKSAIRDFKNLEHRTEFVAEVDGIRVFNDSKATNPDAAICALKSFNKEVTLILGGKDKDMDFSVMIPAMEETVENVILIGEAGPKIASCFNNYRFKKGRMSFSVYSCSSFKEAVDKCFKVAGKGKVILLSPACASFDMFKDYNDRGKQFKELVLERALRKKDGKQ